MSKYAITFKGKNTIVAEGQTPQQAFASVFTGKNLFCVEDADEAMLCIELLDGQRESKKYYTLKNIGLPLKFRIKDFNTMLLNAELIGIDTWVATCEFMLNMGYRDTHDWQLFSTECGHLTLLIQTDKHHAYYIIPCNVTDIGNHEFVDCLYDKLNIYVIGGENLTTACGIFNSCYAKSLDLTQFKTDKITDMSWMFYRCQLKTIQFGSFDTSKVLTMSHMFAESRIKTLDLSSFNTESLKDSDRMFDKAVFHSVWIANRQLQDELYYGATDFTCKEPKEKR